MNKDIEVIINFVQPESEDINRIINAGKVLVTKILNNRKVGEINE